MMMMMMMLMTNNNHNNCEAPCVLALKASDDCKNATTATKFVPFNQSLSGLSSVGVSIYL